MGRREEVVPVMMTPGEVRLPTTVHNMVSSEVAEPVTKAVSVVKEVTPLPEVEPTKLYQLVNGGRHSAMIDGRLHRWMDPEQVRLTAAQARKMSSIIVPVAE